MRLYQQGFTLTEALLTVLIIGILAAIAIPAYQSSVVKSRRVAAHTLALDLAAREERFFLQRNTYTAELGAEGLGLESEEVTSTGRFVYTPDRRYRANIRECDGGQIESCFRVRVKALGQQLEDDPDCEFFLVNSFGERWSKSKKGIESYDLCW